MDDEILEFPIDGTLDLHTFPPGQVKDLVADYIDECRQRSIYQVRIIHGKGTGTLRRTVHGVLKRLPAVKKFSLAQDRGGGGWGGDNGRSLAFIKKSLRVISFLHSIYSMPLYPLWQEGDFSLQLVSESQGALSVPMFTMSKN